MTRRVFCLTASLLLVALLVALPASAGIFGDGEPKAAKGINRAFVSYIEGTVKGIAPHTTGTLVMNDHKVMVFQHAKGSVVVPYKDIVGTELGSPRGKDAGPSYKVWNVYKRFGDKTRYLTVNYAENGMKNKMVLELAERPANLTVSQIEIRQGKRQGNIQELATSDEQWWGDKFWRTNRNSEKWNKKDSEAPKTSSAPDR